ncbi:unnamed protein product [Brassica rapa]|uniref:Uncharacterized protein n=3 Tax=Brassica TaxID=3705 RepID=A0A8D9M437_BRACM|nr:unnamed protein product [Brassica napus]CAG7896952.1 unnamed protein product [Brassica rapa]CDY17038.1 BnaA08g04020D [Brassica napus]
MSSCDAAVVAPTSFDTLRLGRSAQVTVAPLLRFWDSRNIKEQGEFMGITLLFLDEQNSVIHEFIHTARLTHYRPSLRSGSIVKDIVGMIRSVQGSDLKDAGVMTRVVVGFAIEPSMEIYLSLWDEPAVKFRDLLKSGDRTNSVILVLFILQAPCLSNHLQLPILFGTPISHPSQSSQLDARGKSSPVSRL